MPPGKNIAQSTLIDKLAATGDAIKHDYHKYLDFNQKFNGTEKTFQDLDASLPTTVPELAKFTGNDWKHTIAVHVLAADRENVLGQIIAALKWTDDKPQSDDEAFVSTKTNLQKGFAQTYPMPHC